MNTVVLPQEVEPSNVSFTKIPNTFYNFLVKVTIIVPFSNF